ncbi:MAG: 3H domain-containing protein [Methanobacterium sp.]|jgi:2-phosphoglycerate kinase
MARKPYVILIGSASGIGKSTIASELAKTLGIKHLIETDFIREIVRGIIGPEFAPALHKSSFDAYVTIRDKERYGEDAESLISAGFEEHASFVIPAIEKVIRRAIDDYDDIVIEGVHLVPGLINAKQFETDASIHFFVLTSDEEIHMERFVKRAMKIKRGGKHLEYFNENRVINDVLVESAKEHGVNVINNLDIDSTVKRMLTVIRRLCRSVVLSNTVEDIGSVTETILKYGGRVVDISYYLRGFREPVKRKVNIFDPHDVKRFLNSIATNPDRKKDLEELYKLSDNIHGIELCAPDEESLEKMIKELDKKGFLVKENKSSD